MVIILGKALKSIDNKHLNSSISDDVALMQRIVNKDKSAFNQLLDIYMDNVFRFCYGLIKNKEMAEDITQETFLKLWKNPSSWKPTGRLKSWLLRMAHNLSIDELRKVKNHTNIDSVAYNLEDYQNLPDEMVQNLFVEDIVRGAVLKLPDRQRAAVMLSYYSDCSNKEASNIMKVSVDAFESLLARGRKKLKETLAGVKDNEI